jgi:voltage-gated potassium channel
MIPGAMMLIPTRFTAFFSVPVVRRAAYHVKRMTGGLDRSFFLRVGIALVGFLVVCSVATTLAEHNDTKNKNDWNSVNGFFSQLGSWFYWAVTTSMGSGDSSKPHTLVGYIVSWMLVLFGVAIVASITGALVGFLIDYLLKEGQGMGASGYKGHIVVCGWNSTARELIQELSTDEYHHKIVVIADTEKNPAGEGTYFVNGDITTAADLKRAGIEEAMAAVVVPADGSNEADLRSILCVMAIEALAPQVRTVVEANNPAHVEHFQRAHADEIVVSSQLVSRLMARSSLYPGLAEIVTDIVSGGTGSELYRIKLPDECVGMGMDELSSKLRAHRATLISVGRDGIAHVNPPEEFRIESGDHAVVVAESLATLAPLKVMPASEDWTSMPRPTAR